MAASKITRSLRTLEKLLGNKNERRLIDVLTAGLRYNAFEVQFDLFMAESKYCNSQYSSADSFELAYSTDEIDSDVQPMLESDDSLSLTMDCVGGLAWCALACDTGSTRYQMGGVCIACDSFVGTDGRRLHAYKHGFSLPVDSCAIVRKSTIKAVLELIAIWGDKTIQMEVGTHFTTFYGKYWKLKVETVAGRFPDWRQVMPSTDSYTCQSEIPASPIKSELKLRLKLKSLENKIAISTMSKSERKSFDSIPAKWTLGKSDDNRNSNPVVIDAKYGSDAIDGSDNVNIWIKSPDCPVVIGNGYRTAVVMPMKR